MQQEEKNLHATSFKMSTKLYEDLRLMCHLTHTRMGEFIRIAVRDKIKELKGK
jgi:hypothetical protein